MRRQLGVCAARADDVTGVGADRDPEGERHHCVDRRGSVRGGLWLGQHVGMAAWLTWVLELASNSRTHEALWSEHE